jgi:tyrosyl-tRNA synthetase
LDAALRITDALFSGNSAELSENDLEQLCQDGLPSSTLNVEKLSQTPLTQLFTEAGIVKAGREVKDALGRNSVFINGIAKGSEDNMSAEQLFSAANALYGRFFLVKIGKKKYHLFEL